MTAVDERAGEVQAGQSSPASVGMPALEQKLERLGEYLNPILVKEARQAMKSRQFAVTFTLLLICGWLWSLIGVAIRMPSVYWAPTGMFMLIGYYFILAVPLLLVVPFSAYRSLASEREDGTYELLSISTLTARQIVTGKLGSAVLQMLVYYSALAPCIAFTYLLRGVDIISVLLLLSYTFFISLILSCVGLVFAGLSRSRQWHTLIAVVLILALAGATWAWGGFVVLIIAQGVANVPMDEGWFWMTQAAMFTLAVSYIAILILVAAAQNSFPSDNRSTPIRIALLVQLALFAGWIAYAWFEVREWGVLMAALMAAVLHWIVYGVLLTSESARLSPRVRRQLPESFMGRMFLTWLNPGSGTGYVFSVATLGVLVGLAILADFLQQNFAFPAAVTRAGMRDRFLVTAFLMFGYYVAYLGFGRLIVLSIPRREQFGFLLPVVLYIVITMAGVALPFFLQGWYVRFSDVGYTPWQATNWLWTLAESLDHGKFDPLVIVMVVAAAMLLFIINLMLTVREVEATRLDTPLRVQEDTEAR